MRKLISQKRWKDQLLRRQRNELERRSRLKTLYKTAKKKRGFAEIRVPAEFSIIYNAMGVNSFLQKLKLFSRSVHISLDLTDLVRITPDAIAALAATIDSLPDTVVRGNLPSDPDARQVLLESGFFEHVRSTTKLPEGQLGKIQKRTSRRVEARTAQSLIECGTMQAFGVKGKSNSTRAAYTTLIELMGNTHNHAAPKRHEPETWWAMAFGDAARKRVCYSFLDTGVGIFRSVKVRLIKRLLRNLGIQTNADLLLEILQGHVESSTGLRYRGKGLPTIYQKSQTGDIKSLFIIANDVYADVSGGSYRTLEIPFPGTLLYWECEE